jgi:formate--tetrahydrofolate ligase
VATADPPPAATATPRTNLDIARSIRLEPITDVAGKLGLLDDEVLPYGKYIAKIDAGAVGRRLRDAPTGRYVDITGITPTPLGEGKSTVTVGLSMALNALGKRTIGTIRQPSMGPLFGIKGGAAGGGYSQCLPMEDFNLGLTGDIHAVALAHNLLSAVIDAHLAHGNQLDIDPVSIVWPRVVDMNDRALRQIVVGLGGRANGQPREDRFDIAVASEVMAILSLARDIGELRERLAKITVAYTRDRKPVTAGDLQAAGAMAALLKSALQPNLLQTTEHTPMIVHTGPFANIAHGNSSLRADLVGLKLADYVVTESGFGADMGFEKFMHLKCRAQAGLFPDVAVVVCTVRALKMHSGKFRIVAGRPLDPGLREENLDIVAEGAVNLEKHIENVGAFGVPAVVAVNRFIGDSPRELELITQLAKRAGAVDAHVADLWERGSAGGLELARAVAGVAETDSPNGRGGARFLYPLEAPIKDKIAAVARTLYGADGVEYLPEAERQIRHYTALGWDSLPVCIAKTQNSLSDNPNLKGRPRGFQVTIREVRAYTGAGFLCPIAGEIMTMPGLPSNAAYAQIDVDERGEIVGLF